MGRSETDDKFLKWNSQVCTLESRDSDLEKSKNRMMVFFQVEIDWPHIRQTIAAERAKEETN